MDRKKIKRPLSQFVKKTVEKINPDRIILYGSFARGKASTWSDIDIAVIAPFVKKTIRNRLNILDKIACSVESDFLFDVRGYRKDEFDKISPLSIYSEIKREGVIVYKKSH